MTSTQGSQQAEALVKEIAGGGEPRQSTPGMLERAQDLVVTAAVPDAAAVGLLDKTPEEAAALREQAGRFGSAAAVEAAEIIAGRRAEGADFGAEAANGPQPPAVHDLYRARERVLEVDQAGGSPAGVAQAKMNARQTEAAYIQAEDRRMEDPAYRAEIEASYDSDRYPDLEAGW